jgi:murein L,D-transpeptidase YcbB/YkuD
LPLPPSNQEPDPAIEPVAPARALPRRAALVGAAAGLGALALTGCAAPESEPRHLASSQPEDDLDRLRDGADPIVAGESLNGALLRRFYARRGFEPVWLERPAQARALADAVLHAGDHGLDPEMFHAPLLQRISVFPPLRAELLLSHAVLSYAEALAFGAVPAHRRAEGEALAADPVDVAALLDAALDGPDPVGAIEALAPRSPTYRALREALARHRAGGPFDGAHGARLRLIRVNLERQRWLPRRLPADRVWVNVADQRLVLYQDDRPVFTSRVIVGDDVARKQSPEFHTVIEAAFFNPPWVIPPDIVELSIRPRLSWDPDFLVRNNIVFRPDGEVEQAPGPMAALGAVLFDMPNRFDVFLHDTPDRTAFERDNRRLSNGCIRVHKPLELAALLMEEPIDVIHAKVAAAVTQRKPLARPMPVFLVYQTAFVSSEHGLEVRPDFYGRDGAIWRGLQKRPEEAPAQGSGAGGPVVLAGMAPPRGPATARVTRGARPAPPARPLAGPRKPSSPASGPLAPSPRR